MYQGARKVRQNVEMGVKICQMPVEHVLEALGGGGLFLTGDVIHVGDAEHVMVGKAFVRGEPQVRLPNTFRLVLGQPVG